MGCMDSDPATYPEIVEDWRRQGRVGCALAQILAGNDDRKLKKIILAAKINWDEHAITAAQAIEWLVEHRQQDRLLISEEEAEKMKDMAEYNRLKKKLGK